MCGVLSEASNKIWSNEHRRFIDVTGLSGLFNRLYTNTDIPFAVQQLLRTQRSSHVERPAICEIFPDVCVVQVGIAVYSYLTVTARGIY